MIQSLSRSALHWALACVFGAFAPSIRAAAAPTPVNLVAITAPSGIAPTPAVSNLAKECEIPRRVGEGAVEQLKRAYPGMVPGAALPKLEGEQRGLQLTVVNMFGLGGGGYSGPKWMIVRAELMGPDGVVSSRDFRRVSAASFVGMFAGTCPVMSKVASAIGHDIRGWLNKGAPNQVRRANAQDGVPTDDDMPEEDERVSVPQQSASSAAPTAAASTPTDR